MATKPETDHRTRAAAARRAKMRERLIESAVLVFAEKGVDASVIDDVIATAGVSRGTFYNYFRSNQELLSAAGDQLGDELVEIIEHKVSTLPDPAERLATGIRLFIETARRYPLLGRFTARAGLESGGPGNLIYDYLPVHIRQGIAQGRFINMPMTVALDLIRGTAVITVYRLSIGNGDETDADESVAAILRGLGLSPADAQELVKRDLPELVVSNTGLLERSKKRAEEAGIELVKS
ncbi:TetR/AcrR family transcriptional regulator [Lutimaribacter marinistellae]|uniref:TetR/AcrR family transcriptional regulator n=1 Tax=Lutimaribacter marinistellae TaxID=1820329 RepID=A0ABV7TC25_9RHOB